ncbi:DUF3871 family protein [Mesonia mobilis]|uniref:DUF3871 family protein n=1 Tax=Mesonia mobilis TaxID=369791 RepID=A0ABQ3BVX0_9FLAO|nr:DUF3871 family protein [Mesonia mobilis]MBQ0739106.1 DUF3871 family protein [Aquimarina celericrescens]GGZ56442.1 hypothetical protein GCM10008088_17520 [Mesonia mobilis]
MELIKNNYQDQIVSGDQIVNDEISKGNFIEANTIQVSLEHLKNDCIIPVFSKDNESTISHYQFINQTFKVAQQLFPDRKVLSPNIRVSHVIKGRIPSAVGKPAKELLDREKTIYYERCAFMIEIPEIIQEINGNKISLVVGGVRAYNQENLYSKKSLEKFKVFIGFKNWVCTNLCISSDGFSNEIRIASIDDLENQLDQLFTNYNAERHLNVMAEMKQIKISEEKFAHLIGKCRMYQHLSKQEKQSLFPIEFNDGQLSNVVKNYYFDANFKKRNDEELNLWQLYNLFTGANKSSYIDNHLERNVNAYEFINHIGFSINKGNANWFLTN